MNFDDIQRTLDETVEREQVGAALPHERINEILTSAAAMIDVLSRRVVGCLEVGDHMGALVAMGELEDSLRLATQFTWISGPVDYGREKGAGMLEEAAEKFVADMIELSESGAPAAFVAARYNSAVKVRGMQAPEQREVALSVALATITRINEVTA